MPRRSKKSEGISPETRPLPTTERVHLDFHSLLANILANTGLQWLLILSSITILILIVGIVFLVIALTTKTNYFDFLFQGLSFILAVLSTSIVGLKFGQSRRRDDDR